MDEFVRNAVNIGLIGFFTVAGFLALVSILDSGIKALAIFRQFRQQRRTKSATFPLPKERCTVLPYDLGVREIRAHWSQHACQSYDQVKAPCLGPSALSPRYYPQSRIDLRSDTLIIGSTRRCGIKMSDIVWFGLESLTLLCLMITGLFCWRLVVKNVELSSKLSQTKEILRHAETLGKIGTWSIDIEDRRVHWSDRVFEVHARSVALGEPSLEDAINFYHEDDRNMVQAKVTRAVEAGVPFEFTARLVAEDGKEKNVLTRGLCSTGVHGDVDQVFGVFIETAHVIPAGRVRERQSGTGSA